MSEPYIGNYKPPVPNETDRVLYYTSNIPGGTLAFVMDVKAMNVVLFVPRLNATKICYHKDNPALKMPGPAGRQQRDIRGWWDFAPEKDLPPEVGRRLAAMEKLIAALSAKVDAAGRKKPGRPSKKEVRAAARNEKIIKAATAAQSPE